MLLRMNLIAIAVVAASIGGSDAAVAQGTMQQQNACEPDVFRLCGNYTPNVEKSSPACAATRQG